jgi:hypothetical protein
MVRTHPNLVGYSQAVLEGSIEKSLAQLLGMTSSEIQLLALRMPSVLGMSKQGLVERIHFWTAVVGLTIDQLRGVALTHRLSNPSLLSYSMDNLQSKLDFFRRRMGISRENMIRLTTSHPDLWGRSLDRHYLPLVEQFCGRVNLTETEFGQAVLCRAPHVLKCHWEGSLSRKLDFLQSRLGLNDVELRTIVVVSPSILLSSIRGMESKLDMLSNAASAKSTVKRMIVSNPSLLQNSAASLEKRLERVRSESLAYTVGLNTAFSESTRSENVAQRRRRSREVWLLSGGEEAQSLSSNREERGAASVHVSFSSVAEAAEHAGTSCSTMYRFLRQGRPGNGSAQYVYAGLSSIVGQSNSPGETSLASEIEVSAVAQDFGNAINGSSSPSLVMYAAGRAFPATRSVRGNRRGGGMALYVPTWTSAQWKSLASRVWKGQEDRIRLLKNGCLIMGYPYTRPSQRRCSLYVVREALRVALEISMLMPGAYDDFAIVTDSHYVVDLLGNSSRVSEWGEAETAKAFRYEGPMKRYQANLDVLYPLSRTCYHLMAMNNSVSFALTGDFPEVPYGTLAEGARLAARHMFEIT